MKKMATGVLIAFFAAAVAASPARAQGKKVEFGLHAGVMSWLGGGESFSDVLLTLSPQVDIHVTRGFMISPEAQFLADTEFSTAAVLPGVMFNYLGGGFYAGVGVVVPVSISEGLDTGTMLPKLNLGYRGRHVNLGVYLITSTEAMFSDNLVGASLGYRF